MIYYEQNWKQKWDTLSKRLPLSFSLPLTFLIAFNFALQLLLLLEYSCIFLFRGCMGRDIVAKLQEYPCRGQMDQLVYTFSHQTRISFVCSAYVQSGEADGTMDYYWNTMSSNQECNEVREPNDQKNFYSSNVVDSNSRLFKCNSDCVSHLEWSNHPASRTKS